MGRAGQKVLKDEDALGDRVSLGLLARAFPRATVEAVVQAAGARGQRTRMLPSWLVVYYVLALALFMDMGGGRVMRKLAGTLSWAARGPAVVLPSEEALSRAPGPAGAGPVRVVVRVGGRVSQGSGGGFGRVRHQGVDRRTAGQLRHLPEGADGGAPSPAGGGDAGPGRPQLRRL